MEVGIGGLGKRLGIANGIGIIEEEIEVLGYCYSLFVKELSLKI